MTIDAINRSIRTFFQAFIGVLLTNGILSTTEETGVVDWSVLKIVVVSAFIAGVVAVITYIHNVLEDSNIIPRTLKNSN